MYSEISQFYNEFTSDIDYVRLSKAIDGIINGTEAQKEYRKEGKAPLLLDCACGTGTLTAALSDIGYDCIGLDVSDEMLNVAREKYSSENILWICQDMCKMDLYGSIAAVTCITDSVNHVLNDGRLESFFAKVHNFLDVGGVFIFDALTEEHFTGNGGMMTYFADFEDATCLWTGKYSAESRICTYDITCFRLLEDGRYERSDDRIREKVRDCDEIISFLKRAGFGKISVRSGRSLRLGKYGKDRQFFVCIK